MDTFTSLLKSQGKKLDLAEDIEALEALATIREHWEQLRGAAATHDSEGVITFIETLLKGAEDGPLVTALNDLRLPGEKLHTALAKLGDTFQRIDRKYVALLKPVASFDEEAEQPNEGRLEWPLVGSKQIASPARARTKPTYAFDLGVSAKLELEAGDTWPGTETRVADPLLRIGLEGGFELGAGARIPFSGGALGVGAQAKRAAFLDYYFDVRADESLFAAAVVRRLDSLPNPLSLDSVFSAFESSDIAGAVLETKGESAFSVDVSLADAFAFKHDVKANLGLTFTAKVRRNNTFMLRLRKVANVGDGSFGVEIALERLHASERERETELGVDVDLASLGNRLATILGEHQGKLRAVLEEYGDYLRPGTYLQNAALKAVRTEFVSGFTQDAKLQAALDDLAQNALGLSSGSAGKKLELLVEEKIVALLDGADGVITGRLDEVAQNVGTELASRLGFEPALLGTVVAHVGGLVESIRADLEKRIEKLSAAKLNALMSKVGAAGAKAAGAGSKADKALAGVRDAIGKYEAAIAKLKAAAADAAKMKVIAKLSARKSSGTERAVDAKLLFKRPSASAQKHYSDIVSGDLDALVDLMRTGSADVEVIESETTLSERQTSSRSVGFTAVLVGFELGSSSLFDAEAEVVIQGGRVAVITKGELRRRRSKPHEEREVSFVDVYELSAAETLRELDIALTISNEDDKLRRREVERVIGGFQSAALLPEGTLERAFATFDRWVGPGERNRIPADIEFALRLEGKQLERVMCIDRRDASALPPAVQREIFGKVLAELVQSGFHDEEHVARVAAAVHDALGGRKPVPPPEDVLFQYTPKVHKRLVPKGRNDRRRTRLDAAAAMHARCMSLVDVFETMGDIYTAVPKIGRGEGWDAKQYRAAQEELTEALADWLKAGWRDSVRPRTIAFVGTLIALAKLDGQADSGFLSLTMTKRGLQPETVVLA